jgi:hypothetical protein
MRISGVFPGHRVFWVSSRQMTPTTNQERCGQNVAPNRSLWGSRKAREVLIRTAIEVWDRSTFIGPAGEPLDRMSHGAPLVTLPED